MKTSEKIDLLAAALVAAQSEIGNATKNAKNPHFKNNYADLGAIIDAVKPVLNKHGIAVIQSLSYSLMGEEAPNLMLGTRLVHVSGQWIEDYAKSPLPKADPQGVGSATTYLRRYSLAAFLCITQEDDDGEGARPVPVTPASKDQIETLKALDQARVAKALAFYKVSDPAQLDSNQAKLIINKIQNG